MNEVTVAKIFVYSGTTLLVIAIISAIAEEWDRFCSRHRASDTRDNGAAEASFSIKAFRIAGRPAFIFGIVCLVIAFTEYQSIPAEIPSEVVNTSISPYPGGGEGALLVTIPPGQAATLFEGLLVVRYEYGIRGGLKVAGGMCSKILKGSYKQDKINMSPGDQAFIMLDDGRIKRVNMLSINTDGTVVFTVHGVNADPIVRSDLNQ